jgi:hypothetical protein
MNEDPHQMVRVFIVLASVLKLRRSLRQTFQMWLVENWSAGIDTS